MKVDVLKVDGIEEALLGMGLSYGLTSDKKIRCLKDPKLAARLTKICVKCAQRGNGEDKFLRMIQIWADVTAPRFWWAEFDTYKVGTVALSESTMHTLGKRPLAQKDFEGGLPIELLDWLNTYVCADCSVETKKTVPPGRVLPAQDCEFQLRRVREHDPPAQQSQAPAVALLPEQHLLRPAYAGVPAAAHCRKGKGVSHDF